MYQEGCTAIAEKAGGGRKVVAYLWGEEVKKVWLEINYLIERSYKNNYQPKYNDLTVILAALSCFDRPCSAASGGSQQQIGCGVSVGRESGESLVRDKLFN